MSPPKIPQLLKSPRLMPDSPPDTLQAARFSALKTLRLAGHPAAIAALIETPDADSRPRPARPTCANVGHSTILLRLRATHAALPPAHLHTRRNRRLRHRGNLLTPVAPDRLPPDILRPAVANSAAVPPAIPRNDEFGGQSYQALAACRCGIGPAHCETRPGLEWI